VPPPPPPPIAPDVLAKKEIMAVLERFRVANEERNFGALKEVWPSAYPSIEDLFKSVRSSKYEHTGEPKIDLQLEKNVAVVEVPTKQTNDYVSGKRPPSTTIATIRMSRANANNRWQIMNVVHKRPE
jgi:hypothetical protein